MKLYALAGKVEKYTNILRAICLLAALIIIIFASVAPFYYKNLHLNIGDCYTYNYEITRGFPTYQVVNKGPKDYYVMEVGSLIDQSFVHSVDTLPRDTYKQVECPEEL